MDSSQHALQFYAMYPTKYWVAWFFDELVFHVAGHQISQVTLSIHSRDLSESAFFWWHVLHHLQHLHVSGSKSESDASARWHGWYLGHIAQH